LEQGQVLVKTWSVQNNGQEAWPESKLIFLRGDRELLGDIEEFSVVAAQPGQTVEVSVPITTPTKPGNYSAYFQLADANRAVFGPRLWLEVVVTRDEEDERKLAPSSAVVAPAVVHAPVASSAPVVDTSGWVDVKVETSPVKAASVAPSASSAPSQPAASIVAVPKPAQAPSKYETHLASLLCHGFQKCRVELILVGEAQRRYSTSHQLVA